MTTMTTKPTKAEHIGTTHDRLLNGCRLHRSVTVTLRGDEERGGSLRGAYMLTLLHPVNYINHAVTYPVVLRSGEVDVVFPTGPVTFPVPKRRGKVVYTFLLECLITGKAPTTTARKYERALHLAHVNAKLRLKEEQRRLDKVMAAHRAEFHRVIESHGLPVTDSRYTNPVNLGAVDTKGVCRSVEIRGNFTLEDMEKLLAALATLGVVPGLK